MWKNKLIYSKTFLWLGEIIFEWFQKNQSGINASWNILQVTWFFFFFSFFLKWFLYLFYIHNNVCTMQPDTDLESQPYSWHKVFGIRAGSCWLLQQHHTASHQLMGPDLTVQLCSRGQTIGTGLEHFCRGAAVFLALFSGLCFSP